MMSEGRVMETTKIETAMRPGYIPGSDEIIARLQALENRLAKLGAEIEALAALIARGAK
jgi:hypothetical protein